LSSLITVLGERWAPLTTIESEVVYKEAETAVICS